MSLPNDVQSEVNALRAEIERLVEGRWEHAENTAGANMLRSQAKRIVLAAQKVEQAVKQSTYSPR